MNVITKWIQFYTIVFLQSSIMTNPTNQSGSEDSLDNDVQRIYFCGDQLSSTLSQICLIHNSLPHGRRKRRVTDECCRRSCSYQYLADNYCHTVNSQELEKLKQEQIHTRTMRARNTIEREDLDTQVNSEEDQVRKGVLSRRYRQRMINQSSSENVHNIHNSSHENHSHQRQRGKRNCTCRNRREKKIKPRKFGRVHRFSKRLSQHEPELGTIEETGTPFRPQ